MLLSKPSVWMVTGFWGGNRPTFFFLMLNFLLNTHSLKDRANNNNNKKKARKKACFLYIDLVRMNHFANSCHVLSEGS